MKYSATIFALVAASASLVASSPGAADKIINAPRAAASVNAAANDGSKGLASAAKVEEAVELVAAGDMGAITTGATFSSIHAKFQATAPAAQPTAAAGNATVAARRSRRVLKV